MIHFKKTILSVAFLTITSMGILASNKKKEPITPVASNIYWSDGSGKVYYNVNANPSPVVKIALQMFEGDMKAVMGFPAQQKANAPIQIYQLDQLSNKEFSALEKLSTPIHQFITQQDAFWIGTRQGKIIIVGSDARGTAYGILELSRLAGISPWKDYYQVQPQQRKVLSTKTGFESLQVPSIAYRGLLLNNSNWMKSKNYSQLCRLMLRLRANALWQADTKHLITYNKEVTDSFDIHVGEADKITETVGKKHKKHKKSIDEVKILYSDATLSFDNMSPGLIFEELLPGSLATNVHKGKHKNHNGHANVTEAWIANIENPQAATYKLSLMMETAWNVHTTSINRLESHLQVWLQQQFGTGLGNKLYPIITEYYRLTNIRPTKYMTMPYGDWAFHSGEFGNELERYLLDYDNLKSRVNDIERNIPSYQKPAFEQLVKKPIFISALTAEKELEAQEARQIARPGLFPKDEEARAAAALSLTAYQQLKSLDATAQPPVLPGTMTLAEIQESLKDAFDRSKELKPLTYALTKDIIAKNACQWTSTMTAKPSEIPLLGHSMKAVSLPTGASLSYTINTDRSGDARFTLAAIPDYKNEKSEMRVSIRIDEQEPVVISLKDTYNHSAWKMDVWRGQTRKSFFTTLSKGNHKVTIQSLDDDIILDQWILDFDVDREYYVIPVK